MSPGLVIFLTVLIGSAPVIAYSIGSIGRIGVGLWLFTPLPVFYVSYLLNFLLRPVLYFQFGFGYNLTPFNYDVFVLSQVLGAAGVWALMLGYSLLPERGVRQGRGIRHEADESPIRLRILAAQQVSASLCCLLVLSLYTFFIWRANALTLDFGQNRAHFTNAMVGGGYLIMLNIGSMALITIVFVASIWTGRLGWLGYAPLVVYTVLSSFVSTRAYVTRLLFIVLFALFARRLRQGRPIASVKILTGLLVVLVIGVGLGLARGGYASDNPLRPILFLTETFDMSEMLQETIKTHHHLDYGKAWVEELGYTFIPRMFFPDKPTVYGYTRMQLEVAPGLSQLDTFLYNATYPIGLYGEGYFNFGITGMLVLFFGMGLFLRFAANRILDLIHSSRSHWSHAFYLFTYGVLCADSLGYVRSFAQFMVFLVLNSVVYVIGLAATRIGAEVVLMACPLRSPPDRAVADVRFGAVPPSAV